VGPFRAQGVALSVEYSMPIRWRWILPFIGLVLFGWETYASVRTNRDLRSRNPYRKDFYWGISRLQTDPLGKLPPAPCRPEITNCSEWWEIRDVIVDPGTILATLLLSGLPAFFVTTLLVHGFGRLGVNEIYTFFVAAPLLLFAWYYFLGWLLDRLWARRKRRKIAPT